MALYLILWDQAKFHQLFVPALAAAWRQKSFEPCRAFCAHLIPEALAFGQRYHLGSTEPLPVSVTRGLPFDRILWRTLAGELLLIGATAIPEIELAPDTLTYLLAPEQVQKADCPRERFSPIQQAHAGARDLVFGSGYYRPLQAGLNDVADVHRLADYLASLEPERWTVADLAGFPGLADEEARIEELEFARDCFASLADLYRQARAQNQVVVCEDLS